MIPVKDKNIIVGVKYRNSFKWYLTPKSLWIFDLNTLNPGERIKYAKDIVSYREELDIIDSTSIPLLLANIADFKIDTMKLRTDMRDMMLFDESFVEDYLPALYIDFDTKTYYAHNENIDYYKKGISKDFTFVDEDFLSHIDPVYYYWQN